MTIHHKNELLFFHIWEKGGEIIVLSLDVRIYIDARINQIIWGAIALSLIYLR